MKKAISIVGARPNFMKIAPLVRELENVSHVKSILVHTGQHYDGVMSRLFFEELGIPRPEMNLGVGSASHAAQTAAVMTRLEPILVNERPDVVIVVGDVNSTLAAAITAKKLGLPVAHVEAGLRSFDRSMPEELNRVLTDSISDLLFVTERSAEANLLREGVAAEKIHFVGNVMIDTLLQHKNDSERSTILNEMGLEGKSYGLVTLHRPANVDSREVLAGILRALEQVSRKMPLIFPCHPRTRARVVEFGLLHHFMADHQREVTSGVRLCDPLGYLDFLKLMSHSRIVFTDSGGIQEETTILGVPCLTLRENTERPVTVTEGTNSIVGSNEEKIIQGATEALALEETRRTPRLWDGNASRRIVDILISGCLSPEGPGELVERSG